MSPTTHGTGAPLVPISILRSPGPARVEEGLPLVRVANNGVSGVVDAAGRVVARIDLDTVGYADLPLPAAADNDALCPRRRLDLPRAADPRRSPGCVSAALTDPIVVRMQQASLSFIASR